ncbi:uncharacterized protein [Musca autumnalis]|uniref:uncharacterized protein n=1 Tax=Musca autumnalis TaxID=221902 RepID=UPI003CED81C0
MNCFNNIFTILLLVASLACYAIAAPATTSEHAPNEPAAEADNSAADGDNSSSNNEPDEHGRVQVISCDLLSYWNVGDTACAAHCLWLGRRGGYCNSQKVCVCRY